MDFKSASSSSDHMTDRSAHDVGMCVHVTKSVFPSSSEQERMQSAFALLTKFWKTPTITYKFIDEPIEWTRQEKSYVQECMEMWTGILRSSSLFSFGLQT